MLEPHVSRYTRPWCVGQVFLRTEACLHFRGPQDNDPSILLVGEEEFRWVNGPHPGQIISE